MPEQMLNFVNVNRRMPDKRLAEKRVHDFGEIYDRYKSDLAAQQASRCSQCGIPFCQIHCPVHNHIPDWLKLTVEGRMEEAYELSSRTNNLPEVCGRICPQDRLCEGNCVIEQAGHGTVTIGSVETYITETAFANGWVKPPAPKTELDQSVGIIGAGPAGMAAAEEMRRAGFKSMYTTATTGSEDCSSTGFQVSNWRNTSSNGGRTFCWTVACNSILSSKWGETHLSRNCGHVMTRC